MKTSDSAANRATGRILVAVFVLAALAPAAGCTSRKQYAINESILISERRQLEDEIYRVQFELRDALEENERLRAKLDDCEEKEPGAKAKGKKSSATGRKDDANDPRFPGGDLLNVGDSSDSGSLQDDVEMLPDFVPVPASRAANQPRSQGAAPPNYSAKDARQGVVQTSWPGREGARRVAAYPTAPQYDPDEDEDYDAEEDEEEWAPVPVR